MLRWLFSLSSDKIGKIVEEKCCARKISCYACNNKIIERAKRVKQTKYAAKRLHLSAAAAADARRVQNIDASREKTRAGAISNY